MARLFVLRILFSAILCGQAASGAPTALVMEEFMGGTGHTVMGLVKAALEDTGDISVIEPAEGLPVIRGSSSAGRIDGALVSGSGQVLFNNQYETGDMRLNASAFADDIVEAISGVAGIASTNIAFVSDVTGAAEIHMTSPDGKRVRQITRDRALNGSPSLGIGPEGPVLVHTSYNGGFADIVLTNLSTGERERIINAPGTNSGATFNHDGTRLALSMSHDGDPEIYTASPRGSGLRRLTESRSVEFSPAWSPDGQRLVFCSDAGGQLQLYIKHRRTGKPERLEPGYTSCTSPDWSVDGHHIAFTARKGRTKLVALFDLNTGKSKELLSNAEDPTWAPDGRHLAAVKDGGLVILDTRTGKIRKILTNYGKISEPSWSK